MTETERLQRIYELLAKACMLDWAKSQAGETSEFSDCEARKDEDDPTRDLTDEERIITYLQSGAASPKELSVLLKLSRRTLNRRLSKLLSDGMIVRRGRTKQTKYGLTRRSRRP